jgi:hypothetical protein
MIMFLRVVRALAGVFAIVFAKACLQPTIEWVFGGDNEATERLLWRAVSAILMFYSYFALRKLINDWHARRTGEPEQLLRHRWQL